MPNLPQDIIVEILIRLPVKSLLKFRCVSKSWLCLISSPKFIKAHLTYSTLLDTNLSNHRIMLKSYNNSKHCSVSCAFLDLWTDVASLDCSNFRLTKRNFKIQGSCNGLLCIVGDLCIDGILLWNPSLRMLKKLPPPTRAIAKWDKIACGMGYDEPNDDYNIVVLFLIFCDDDDYLYVYAAETYSLKHGSWRRFDEFDGGVLAINVSVIYAKGKFHFKASLLRDDVPVGSKWDIVSLDLENKVYGTVEPPISDVFYSIGVLKDCIGALYAYYPLGYNDLWVQKEYGVKESWTKLVRIPLVDGPPLRYSFYQFPLCISSSGKVLLGRGYHLVVYNPADNSFIYYPKNGNPDVIRSMGMFVESLVPLPK